MARTKSTVSTTSTVDKTNVEAAETKIETKEEKSSENIAAEIKEENATVKKTDKKIKTDKVVIKNLKSAYKRIRVFREVYIFDGEGKAIVSHEDAERFLKLPGYELA